VSHQQRLRGARPAPDAGTFEDLARKWQAAIVEAEQNRPKLRVVGND
jgi:hypothetical protein